MRITPALHYLHNPKGKLIGMIATHVDDLLYCYLDEGKKTIEGILKKFTIGKTESGRFRYCGLQFIQHEDYSVSNSTSENCRTVKPIEIDKHRKLSEKVTEKELTSLRSVVGSLAWVARYGRPDLCYRVNEMQRACSAKATVQDLKNANKVVELALQGSDLQITFKSDWIDWSDLAVVTFSDASFANEEGFKSQQGRIHYITNASSLKEGSHKMHLISFGSTTLKRVCRATLQAEAYALQTAVEHGDRLRCLICELTGRLDDFKNWHEETQRRMAHVYYTDCRSLSDHVLAEVPRKVQDKRLGIELAALRQGVWTVSGERTSEIYSPYGDHLRWIETSKQLADPLTKSMRPDYLLKTLESGLVNVENSGACEKGAKMEDEEVSP